MQPGKRSRAAASQGSQAKRIASSFASPPPAPVREQSSESTSNVEKKQVR